MLPYLSAFSFATLATLDAPRENMLHPWKKNRITRRGYIGGVFVYLR